VEGEIVQHIDELEEASDYLQALPYSVCLTNAANTSLLTTVSNVRGQADSVLASANRVYNTLQVNAIFDGEPAIS